MGLDEKFVDLQNVTVKKNVRIILN